ncbi:hypothetical protein BC833DRAFT_593632 [Globomyces pollinis-pini]|nr:hypothetical protein BC833DRAFT_593632 [Globomyces pollinis-pini]
MEDLNERKKALLKRLNQEYVLNNNVLEKRIIQKQTPTKKRNQRNPSSSTTTSFKSLEESRDDYVANLKNRIKELEARSPKERKRESKRELKSNDQTTKLKLSENQIHNQQLRDTKLHSIPKETETDMILIPCESCGRKFREERIEIHEEKCRKIVKHRAVFDETAMRTRGTDMAKYIKSENTSDRVASKPTGKVNGAKNKTGTEATQKKKTDGKTRVNPFTLPNDEEVKQANECPHCLRRFSPTAFERHVPICQKLTSAPKRAVYR